MKKNMYYAVYDITDNSTRSSVIHILKNAGFVRVQKSVFCGKVPNQQKKDIVEAVRIVLHAGDSFYLILSCSQCFGKIQIIGKGFDREYVTDMKPSIVL